MAMAMNTSSFTLNSYHPNAVSIADKSPDNYSGREYKKLAPSYSIFAEYKKSGDSSLYTIRYNNEILSKLEPAKVFEELGSEAVLLCYEKPGYFCHRRLVASWLHNHLCIDIPEL